MVAIPGRRGDEQDLDRLDRELGEPGAKQLPKAVRDRQRLAGLELRAATDELAAELEREERVAAARLPDPSELGSGELEAKPGLEQPVQRADAERAERQPRQPAFRERELELERHLDALRLAHRREHADPLAPQAPQRDLKRGGGRAVEPLQVVDGNQHRAPLLELAQRVEDRKPDRVRLRRIVLRLGQEQRDLQRTPAQRRQRPAHVLEDLRQELRQAGEAERGFSLHPAAEQDGREPCPRLAECGAQQGSLADSRLTGDDESGGAREGLGQEDLQRTQLLLAPDQLHGVSSTLAPFGIIEGTSTKNQRDERPHQRGPRLVSTTTARATSSCRDRSARAPAGIAPGHRRHRPRRDRAAGLRGCGNAHRSRRGGRRRSGPPTNRHHSRRNHESEQQKNEPTSTER